MGYSGPGGKLTHEKNQKQKSRDTVPLKLVFIRTLLYQHDGLRLGSAAPPPHCNKQGSHWLHLVGFPGTGALWCQQHFTLFYLSEVKVTCASIKMVHRQYLWGQNLSGPKPIMTKPMWTKHIGTKPIGRHAMLPLLLWLATILHMHANELTAPRGLFQWGQTHNWLWETTICYIWKDGMTVLMSIDFASCSAFFLFWSCLCLSVSCVSVTHCLIFCCGFGLQEKVTKIAYLVGPLCCKTSPSNHPNIFPISFGFINRNSKINCNNYSSWELGLTFVKIWGWERIFC